MRMLDQIQQQERMLNNRYGGGEVKHPSQTHVNVVAGLPYLGLSVTWSSQLKPFLYTSPSLLFPLPSPPPGHLPLLH